ncbi:MAG: TraB/GumN family protein, partial [Marinicella sp.]
FNHFDKAKAPIGSVNERKPFMESLMASGFVSPESLISYLEDIESQRALVKEMKSAYYLHEELLELKKLYRIFLLNDYTEAALIDRFILELDVQSWVDTINQWIIRKPTFISINASYLMGEGGVVEALRQRGFVLEPVL